MGSAPFNGLWSQGALSPSAPLLGGSEFPPGPIPVTFGWRNVYQGTASSALSCGTRRGVRGLEGLWALLTAPWGVLSPVALRGGVFYWGLQQSPGSLPPWEESPGRGGGDGKGTAGPGAAGAWAWLSCAVRAEPGPAARWLRVSALALPSPERQLFSARRKSLASSSPRTRSRMGS